MNTQQNKADCAGRWAGARLLQVRLGRFLLLHEVFQPAVVALEPESRRDGETGRRSPQLSGRVSK